MELFTVCLSESHKTLSEAPDPKHAVEKNNCMRF